MVIFLIYKVFLAGQLLFSVEWGAEIQCGIHADL